MSSSKTRVGTVLLLVATLIASRESRGYSLNGYHWPDGTQIVMHLGLSHTPSSFPDGTGSWDGSATDALNIWNQYIDLAHFVAASAAADQRDDGTNSVFFANNVYGQTWGTAVLAITLYIGTEGSTFSETDVIFNNKLKWSSYRGNILGSGATATWDFHRVALHEFGHVLGLDHPDQYGQSVVAVMNSIISDLDHLAEDDIAGAQFLYGVKITSSLGPIQVNSGVSFSYQITANNNPSHFSATGLPTGMQLDPVTGLITGHCSGSGTFFVSLVVQGSLGNTTGTLQIIVNPQPLTSMGYSQIQIGSTLSYQIAAQNSPTSFTATGLPAGLQLNTSTGLISGLPQVSGVFDVVITAIGPDAVAGGTVRFIIDPARITSATVLYLDLGDPLSYQITATNSPSSYDANGLPDGLHLNPNTGVITGTPMAAGSFSITLIAHTTWGDPSAGLSLIVRPPYFINTGPWSADIGATFSAQISASNHPTSFWIDNLPSGLHLDPATGRITGVPDLSGHYTVQLNAQGPTSLATQETYIEVKPLDVPTSVLAQISAVGASTIVADPIRPRVYVNTGGAVQVIDTVNLQSTMVSLGGDYASYFDIAISGDGSKLWLLGYSAKELLCIDLNTLTVLPKVPVAIYPFHIRVGSDGRLYLTGNTSDAGVFQVDPTTGATLAHFGPTIGPNFYPCIMEMGADRKTIYIADTSGEGNLSKYQIAPGAAPVFLQQVKAAATSAFIEQIVVNPNGLTAGLISEGPNSFVPNPVAMRACADLNSIQATFPLPDPLGRTGFNTDGSLVLETSQSQSGIKLVNVNTQSLTRTIFMPNGSVPQFMATDKDNSKLFVVGGLYGSNNVFVYWLTPPRGPLTPPKTLLNVATRLETQTGDNTLIGGFIVTGSEPKQVVLRATGPSLPLANRLADPLLELHAPDGTIITNDNWNAHRSDVIAAGLAPLDEHESAIVATLAPGAYTAILRGVADTTGVAVVELYDLSPNSSSHIANISTRGKVETGDNVMIGGFIIGGDQPTKVIVRAIGPSLASAGVSNALADTTLELHDGSGNLIVSNDDWQSDQEQEIIASTVPPKDSHESAIVRTLSPGSYTAIVRGKDNTTGVALVEVYNLESNQ